MKILIIGGTGFIGREIARLAIDAGHEVTLFNRGKCDPKSTVRTIIGEKENLKEFRSQFRALNPDAVIHCIAYTEHDAETFIEVFSGMDSHLIVLGSQDCYQGFQQFRSDKETTDFPLDEDAALAKPYYWRGTQHSHADLYDKNLMTDLLLGAHSKDLIRASVFRLPMVYGPGDPQYQYRHGDIIWRVIDKQSEFVIGTREQGVIWTYGYVTNVAAAVLHAVNHKNVVGSVFNLGETKIRTRRRWADLFAEAGQHSFHYRVVPDEILEVENQLNFPTYHIITDNTAFVRTAGFIEPVTLSEGINLTLSWATNHREALGDRPSYKRQNSIAKNYQDYYHQQLDGAEARI